MDRRTRVLTRIVWLVPVVAFGLLLDYSALAAISAGIKAEDLPGIIRIGLILGGLLYLVLLVAATVLTATTRVPTDPDARFGHILLLLTWLGLLVSWIVIAVVMTVTLPVSGWLILAVWWTLTGLLAWMEYGSAKRAGGSS